MGRRPLPLGHWGEPKYSTLPDGRIEVYVRVRDFDGATRRVKARADTRVKALRNLNLALSTRYDNANMLYPHSTVPDLIQDWLRQRKSEGRLTLQTIERYEDNIRGFSPHLRGIRLDEANTPVLQRTLLAIEASRSTNYARKARIILVQAFAHGQRLGVVDRNPATATLIVAPRRPTPKALSTESVHLIRAKAWEKTHGKATISGPKTLVSYAVAIDIFSMSRAMVCWFLSALTLVTVLAGKTDSVISL